MTKEMEKIFVEVRRAWREIMDGDTSSIHGVHVQHETIMLASKRLKVNPKALCRYCTKHFDYLQDYLHEEKLV